MGHADCRQQYRGEASGDYCLRPLTGPRACHAATRSSPTHQAAGRQAECRTSRRRARACGSRRLQAAVQRRGERRLLLTACHWASGMSRGDPQLTNASGSRTASRAPHIATTGMSPWVSQTAHTSTEAGRVETTASYWAPGMSRGDPQLTNTPGSRMASRAPHIATKGLSLWVTQTAGKSAEAGRVETTSCHWASGMTRGDPQLTNAPGSRTASRVPHIATTG